MELYHRDVSVGKRRRCWCFHSPSIAAIESSPRGGGSAPSIDRDRHRAAVLGPAVLVRAERYGALLAVADRGQTARVDAEADQVVLGRIGAPLAQREVVVARAALVAV